MTAAGFTISGKDHPICPVMLGDARLAAVMAEDMLSRGERGREPCAMPCNTGSQKPFCHPLSPQFSLLASSSSPCFSSPGIYVIGFSYPVVPKGKARIRVQISAVHSDEDIDRCVEAFIEVGQKHGALP